MGSAQPGANSYRAPFRMDRITPPQLMQMLDHDYTELQNANHRLVELARERAEMEKEYHVLFATRMLQIKNQGKAVTLIKDLTRGEPDVCNAKYNLDVAEAKLTACREGIRNYREHIGVLRSLLTWQRAELQAGHIAPF